MMKYQYGLQLGLQSVEAEIAAEAKAKKELEAVVLLLGLPGPLVMVPVKSPSLFEVPGPGAA